ncbi:hypothetical protein OSB04_007984 [Centaurea solstitialis]|uniref:Uncharacterized protein n=1 Tax=Centaurea solstitialis TaxID=347529 RepID=A0AA38TMM0_9ASTR|nr:hypothetical protein OSB04_007984 [Centaurea solstitialis]
MGGNSTRWNNYVPIKFLWLVFLLGKFWAVDELFWILCFVQCVWGFQRLLSMFLQDVRGLMMVGSMAPYSCSVDLLIKWADNIPFLVATRKIPFKNIFIKYNLTYTLRVTAGHGQGYGSVTFSMVERISRVSEWISDTSSTSVEACISNQQKKAWGQENVNFYKEAELGDG